MFSGKVWLNLEAKKPPFRAFKPFYNLEKSARCNYFYNASN